MAKKFILLLLMAILTLVPTGVGAVLSVGLIKGSSSAVYYYGGDGHRYVFPSDKIFYSWYTDFSGVQVVADSELGSIPLGRSNITYHPGQLVKLTTDPKVYVVDSCKLLRWVKTESVAISLYRVDWAKQVHDLPDAFWSDYVFNPALPAVENSSDIDLASLRQTQVQNCSAPVEPPAMSSGY